MFLILISYNYSGNLFLYYVRFQLLFPKVGEATPMNLVPERSKRQYEMAFKTFMEWREQNNIDSFTEKAILFYFQELSEKYKSPSLWSQYSMLKCTLSMNIGVNIEHYTELRAFLKQKSKGYKAKKAKTFTSDEIHKFINDAPDTIYLATKVALILAVMGTCRANELHSMNIEDFQDLGSALLVTIPNLKRKAIRKVTITDHFYEICKKYTSLRPTNAPSSFFLNYYNGKCTVRKIGVHKLGGMGRQIAAFLGLPNPEMYTAHSFCKSSVTIYS